MVLTGVRTALRIARREAWRAKGRSLLVVALIGLPVAGLGAGAAIYDSFDLRPGEQARRALGAADAAVRMDYDVPVMQPPDDLVAVPPEGSDDATTRPHGEAEMLDVLPPGTRLIPDRRGEVTVATRTGIAVVPIRGLDYAHPMARGILRQREGRAPRDSGEVALTEAAAARTGLTVGRWLRVEEPVQRRLRVVGIVEDPTDLATGQIVTVPDGMPGEDPAATRWIADTPVALAWSDVLDLNQRGMVALSRAVLLNPPPAGQVPLHAAAGSAEDAEALRLSVIVVGIAVLEVVLLAGPAFAIGARRRARDLALVTAGGGTPGHLRWIVLADGVVLGLAGALAGLLVGVLAARVGLPYLEEHLVGRRAGGFRPYPLALAGIAGLAVFTGLLAALLPAFVAARQNPVQALAGLRGITRSRRRWVLLGGFGVLAGGGIAGLGAWSVSMSAILIGLVVAELGLAICTPALIGAVSRLGGWLPLAPRIALRNTSRTRSAAAPAIAGVMAAVASAVTIGMFMDAEETRNIAMYRPALPDGRIQVSLDPDSGPTDDDPVRLAADAEAAVRRTVPVDDLRVVETVGCMAGEVECQGVSIEVPAARRCPLEDISAHREPTEAEARRYRKDARCAPGGGDHYWTSAMQTSPILDDGSGLATVLGVDPEEIRRARRVLRAGGVLVAEAKYVESGEATVVVAGGPGGKGDGSTPHEHRVPAYVLRSGTLLPGVFAMSPALAERLNLTTRPVAVVAAPSRAVTQADEDRIRALSGLYVHVERGPGRPDGWARLVVLGSIAGLITLGAAAIATGLVAADARAELSVLAAVGAAPRLRRGLMLFQSGMIAGMGTLLGALAGVGAATALILAMNRAASTSQIGLPPLPITIPWELLLLTAVAVPVIAMLGAAVLTRSRLPIERRLA